ncbi:MAG: cell envelope integrity protein TolA [Pseudomonadota bacterium]
MSGPADRYAPPPPPGRWRAIGAAVVVHVLLIGALTWGVNWREDPKVLSAAAELWAPTVQEAAPKPVEAPPPPPPPAPVVRPPPPAPAGPAQADIALEREKKRQADQRRQQQEQAERLRKEQADKAEARKRELAEQQRAADQKKREQARREQQRERERDEQETRRMAQLREENMRRIQGLAGATGAPTATGTAQRAAGPSDSYGGRIRARVRPNIVFTDPVSGNAVTEVEVRMAPDGTITSRKITKSSGLKAWDDAVLRALDRTEVLPRDLDGRVHSPLLMEFRPRD